jgi:hypothetical protein
LVLYDGFLVWVLLLDRECLVGKKEKSSNCGSTEGSQMTNLREEAGWPAMLHHWNRIICLRETTIQMIPIIHELKYALLLQEASKYIENKLLELVSGPLPG